MRKNSRRTVYLAIFAAAAFVYSAVFHFDVDPQIMLGFFLGSLAMVLAAIVCATLFVFVLRLLKREND